MGGRRTRKERKRTEYHQPRLKRIDENCEEQCRTTRLSSRQEGKLFHPPSDDFAGFHPLFISFFANDITTVKTRVLTEWGKKTYERGFHLKEKGENISRDRDQSSVLEEQRQFPDSNLSSLYFAPKIKKTEDRVKDNFFFIRNIFSKYKNVMSIFFRCVTLEFPHCVCYSAVRLSCDTSFPLPRWWSQLLNVPKKTFARKKGKKGSQSGPQGKKSFSQCTYNISSFPCSFSVEGSLLL